MNQAAAMADLRQEILQVQLMAEQLNNNALRSQAKSLANAWNQLRWQMPIQPEKLRWLQLRIGDDVTRGTPPPMDLENTFS
jgi:hypothetical protein